MNTKLLLILAGALILIASVAWFRRDPVLPQQQTNPQQDGQQSPLEEPSYLPLSQYQQELTVIGSEYTSGVKLLGVTTQDRLKSKDKWSDHIRITLQRLLRLSAPKEARDTHQNRIIALLTLGQALATPTPEIASIQAQEKIISELWK